MSSDAARAQHVDAPPSVVDGDPARGQTWFNATAVGTHTRSALTQDTDVDICVIGAGLAGLTAAYELARRGWSVAVLESKRIAWNASGRNTGFVLPGYGQSAETIVERVGLDHARELWTLSQAGVDYVRQTVSDGELQGIEPADGWLHVSKTDRKRQIGDEADLLRSLGADVEYWPEKLVRAKLKNDRYFQAIHFPTAFNIHPLNYALGLAAMAEKAGARIYEQTSALSIDPDGVRKRIKTTGGRVRAQRIILAGNVHLGVLMPELTQTLIPVQTFVIVTQPLGEALAETIDYRGGVSDTDRADSHYRIVGGDRLMWCGRIATWDAPADRFGGKLRRDLRKRFPQLAAAEVAYAWSGHLGLSVHRMPQIGEVAPGLWLASGFGGHGLNTTAMAGNLIARAIVEGDDRWRLFAPFELVWAGGRAGRIVMQTSYWTHRAIETWSSRAAHLNEVRRTRNEEQLKKQAEAAAERARLKAEAQQAEDAAYALRRAQYAQAAAAAEIAAEPEPIPEAVPDLGQSKRRRNRKGRSRTR